MFATCAMVCSIVCGIVTHGIRSIEREILKKPTKADSGSK